jgi:SNF2 family DNA or RNA helicase
VALGAAVDARAQRHRLTDPEATLGVLERIEARAGELVVEWPDGAKRVRVEETASTSKLRVRVRSARDWFGLDGEVEVAGATVALGALLEAVRRGARFVELGPRRFARIADELRDKLMATADVVHHAKSKVEFTLAALPTIDALLEGTGDADLTRRFVDLRRRLHQAAQHEPALPKGLLAELRPYQAEGVRWLLRLRAWGAGACLADDMGLGKTLQALALLVDSASEGPSLVVAPTSVVGNWLIEAARFAPSLGVKLLRGGARHALLESASPGDVFVTSYDVMVRDEEQLAATCFANVIFDEAQALKNPVTRRAKAARAIDAAFRLALTGTPIENHLGDLWSLYRVVVPGLLGSAEQFRDRFAAPIERGLNAAERKAALARVVRPFLLRRTKAQVAPELPPRIEVLREIELSAAERALYEGARLAALATLTGSAEGTDQRFAVLAAMTRLRRLACHPRLVDDGSTVASSKLATFLELARELRDAGQKALVFSQFTSHLALVRQALAREGFTYLELDGSTPAEQRQARVAEFQAGKAELFLISLKAGGSGLNLTAAEVVIHLDPWWNPAAEDQATDRAHRIGQARAVTVVRLVARGTIEQAVLALHGTKRALAQSLLEGADVTAKLSSAELLALFQGSNEVANAEIEVESEVE